MKCSIIDRYTISFDHLATPLQHIILDRVACSRGILQDHPDWSSAFCREPGPTWVNVAYKRWSTVCWLVIEADSGPINYWTLHSLWCLLREKHGVTCNKWCNKWKHVWFPYYSCRSWHKSQKCEIFFTPFVIKCMISQNQCHQLADIYHLFVA